MKKRMISFGLTLVFILTMFTSVLPTSVTASAAEPTPPEPYMTQEEFNKKIDDYFKEYSEDTARDYIIEITSKIIFDELPNSDFYEKLFYYKPDMDFISELTERFSGASVSSFLQGSFYFYDLGKGVSDLTKSMKVYAENPQSPDAKDEYISMMQTLFSLCTSTFEFFAPGIGHFISFPIHIANMALEGVRVIHERVVNRNYQYLSLVGEIIRVTGRTDFMPMYHELCELVGLVGNDELQKAREDLGLYKRFLDKYDDMLDFIYSFPEALSEPDIRDAYQVEYDKLEKFIKLREQVFDNYEMLREMYPDIDEECEEYIVDNRDGTYSIVKRSPTNGGELGDSAKNSLNQASKIVSPLVVDFDRDGTDTISLEDGVYFDHANTGFKVKSGWVGPSEGFLVRDINGNGQIDSGRELFGDNTVLSDGLLARNGFEALKDLDSNSDGVFNSSDSLFEEIMIWKDLNSNGISESNELFTLQEAGVVSIDLNYVSAYQKDSYGNIVKQTSKAALTDDVVADIVDIWFVRNNVDSSAVEFIEPAEDIMVLPNIRGTGNVYSLHQAMLRDESGRLKELVEQFSDEVDKAERLAITKQILYVWSGETTNQGVLEAFSGAQSSGNYGANARQKINEGFDDIVKIVYMNLMSQTHLKTYYHLFGILEGLEYDLSATAALLIEELNNDTDYGERLLVEFSDSLHYFGVYDRVRVDSFQDVFRAINIKYELILDGSKNTTFVSSGDSIIKGANGDDCYFISEDFGTTDITDTSGNNFIVFWDGIVLDDINAECLYHVGSSGSFDLKITVAGHAGQIVFKDFRAGNNYIIVLSNGDTYDVVDYLPHNEVRTTADLENISNDLCGLYRLMSDIDLTDVEWEPIGTPAVPFYGMFDGNGYTIRNLNINRSTQDNVGLFGVNAGTIKNVKLDGVTVTGKTNVGSLMGNNTGMIMNSEAQNVAVTSSGNYAGGLIGRSTRNLTELCVSEVNVAASGFYIGGLIGGAENLTDCTVSEIGTIAGNSSYIGGLVGEGKVLTNCSSSGASVTGKTSYIGGLAGKASGAVDSYSTVKLIMATENNSTSRCEIGGLIGCLSGNVERCYATGRVDVRTRAYADTYAGGLVGWANSPTITNSYATGLVPTLGNGTYAKAYTGGLVGYMSGNIENCYTTSNNGNGLIKSGTSVNSYYNRDISSSSADGGLTTAEMQQMSSYAGWDFENVWEISEGSYPTLRGLEHVDQRIEISTAEELQAINGRLSGNYILTADIDLTDVEWEPIGTPAVPFYGMFDGNGYTIRNLNINRSTQDNVGLFGANAGTIKNVKLDGVTVTGKTNVGSLMGNNTGMIMNSEAQSVAVTGYSYVGGLIGISTINLTGLHVDGVNVTASNSYVGGLIGKAKNLTDCSVRGNGTVSLTGSGSGTGGLVGETETLTSCSSSGQKVTSKGSYVGGLAGKASGAVDSYSTVEFVESTYSSGGYIGGLVGYLLGKVERCYATGNVSAINNSTVRIGGLIGYGSSPKIKNSYSTGNVLTFVGRNTGGLVGYMSGNIENCYTTSNNGNGIVGNSIVPVNSYHNRDISGSSADGGLTTAEMQQMSSYAGWDFENVWEMSEGSYPTLRGLELPSDND